jgi:acetolactate synthase-1/2/3 large subunit
LADSYGIKAKRVTKLSQIENALKEAFSVREPFIVDFVIEPMEVV